MVFTKQLRERARRGEITCSVRIWTRPQVKAGSRYRMEEGEIEVDLIEPIGFPDITPAGARIGLPGHPRPAQSREAWQRPEYLSGSVSLYFAHGKERAQIQIRGCA